MTSEDHPDLEALIHDAQNGSHEAFQRIFSNISDRIFAYVLSHTGSRDDALDITQEVFIDLWKGLPKFRYSSNEAFLGFTFVITKRKIARHRASMRANVSYDDQFVDASYEVEYEDYRHLMRALDTLKPKYQEVMRLRYWAGLTFKEIAKALSMKETTAKVMHHRAIEQLRFVYVEST